MKIDLKKTDISVIVLGLLILAVCLSPRFPLPFYIPSRTIDIRAEDIMLLALLFFWGRKILRPHAHIYLTPIYKPFFLYIAVAASTTGIALFLNPEAGHILRTFLYFGKELQFFVLFFLAANIVNSDEHLEILLKFFVGGVFINTLWLWIQILTRKYGPLFIVTIPEGAYHHPRRFSLYGPCLIGESGAFHVALFFAFASYLFYAFFFLAPRRPERKFFLAAGILSTIMSVMSGEKISLVLFAVGIVIIISLQLSKKIMLKIAASGVAVVLALQLLENILVKFISPAIARVFGFQAYYLAIQLNRLDIWKDFVQYISDNFWIGFGKGQILYPGYESIVFGEVHNSYLKMIMETGIFGMIAFIMVLIIAASMCRAVLKHPNSTDLGRVTAATAYAMLAGISVTALVQDAFKTIMPNEILWIFLGLTAAVYKITTSRYNPPAEAPEIYQGRTNN